MNDRREAITEAINAARDDGGGCAVWCCQGPPRCQLMGDEAGAAQRAECPWCEVYYIEEDGRESVRRIGEA